VPNAGWLVIAAEIHSTWPWFAAAATFAVATLRAQVENFGVAASGDEDSQLDVAVTCPSHDSIEASEISMRPQGCFFNFRAARHAMLRVVPSRSSIAMKA